MKQNLLLLQDVDGLGKKGELVSVKPGFARNFLLPKKKALKANNTILRMQERLRKEREEQAIVDRKESEELKAKIDHKHLKIEVKVDPEGHLYGSVSAQDIVDLFAKENHIIEKRWIKLLKPIKELGSHRVELALKEGVEASVTLEVEPEAGIIISKRAKAPSAKEMEQEEEAKLQEAEELSLEAKEEE